MDTSDLRWLIAVENAGSISRVAKTRGVAVSTVARRLDALERALGLRLIDRRRDGVRLTADGKRMIALAGAVVDGVDRLERTAVALRGGEQDRIIVTATEFIVAEVLAPALGELATRHHGLKVDLRSDGAVVSLAAREADLAVRMSPPEGASLLARKLATIQLGLFAHPTYLAGREPDTLNLEEERLLAYDDGYGRLPELDSLRAAGLSAALQFTTNSTRALLTAAVAGAGIALLPAMFALPAGLTGVPGPTFSPRTPFLVVHRDLRRRPGVDAVHRWIVTQFARLR